MNDDEGIENTTKITSRTQKVIFYSVCDINQKKIDKGYFLWFR